MLRVCLARPGMRAGAAARAGPSRPASTENKQLDPRGVDYALFEAPTEEYRAAAAATRAATPASATPALPPPTALLARLLAARRFADARHALAQLQRLHSALGPPLPAYIHAAHWAAAHRHADDALTWLALAPDVRTSPLPRAARMRLHVLAAQTVHWLCVHRAPVAAVAAAHLCGVRGYGAAAAAAALFCCRASPHDAWDAWRAAEHALPTTARRTRVFNRAFAALVRAGHTATARQWARLSAERAPGTYALAPAAAAAVRGARRPARRPAGAYARIAADDLATARAALTDMIMPGWRPGQRIATRGCLPTPETLARFLAAAAAAARPAAFVRPVRAALRAHHLHAVRTHARSGAALLYACALLRALELTHDPAGVFRVWRRRFGDSPGVHVPPGAGAGAHAALAPPHAPTAYAAAVVQRVAVGALPRAALARAYREFVRALVRGDPAASPGCFEPFMRRMSLAAPRAYARAALWEHLGDMQRLGAAPRSETWRIVLQALARAGTRDAWRTLVAVLDACERGAPLCTADARLPDAVLAPAALPALYAGILQVLAPAGGALAPRSVWWNRSWEIARRARGGDTAHAPLDAALARLRASSASSSAPASSPSSSSEGYGAVCGS